MRLGNNMTTMEACNAWSNVCPRKCRPPRIGDIPKHGAVDQESPSSASSRDLTIPPCDSSVDDRHAGNRRPESRPTQLRDSVDESVTITVATTTTTTTTTSTSGRPIATDPERAGRWRGGRLGSGLDQRRESRATTEKSIPCVRARSPIDPIGSSPTSNRRGDVADRRDPPRRDSTLRSGSLDEEDEEEEEIVPSTVSPPEVDRRGASPEESLAPRVVESRKDSALFLEDAEVASRDLPVHSGRRVAGPRRESSGYASIVGTFDEERRGSVGIDSPQDHVDSRRSSATRSTRTRSRPGRKDDSLDEERGANETMPTTELHRKVSGADLDVPVVDLLKDVFVDDPVAAGNELVPTRISVSTDFHDAESSIDRRVSVPTSSSSSSARCDATASTSPDDPTCLDGTLSRLVLSRPRRRTTASRQCSADLASIVEGPQERAPRTDAECTVAVDDRRFDEVPRFVESRPGREYTSSSVPASSNHDVPIDDLSTSHRLLPKSVKVYQFLSTQSEDREDGGESSRLNDRRVSLEITTREDEVKTTSTTTTTTTTKTTPTRHVQERPRLLAVAGTGTSASDGIPDKKPSRNVDGGAPRKLSSSGEVEVSERFLGDHDDDDDEDVGTGANVRPIYPYCPYSPYASPQGSPRNRRRPLRESRRVSIDNRQGALQLNQYKLLDNIGQGSYGIVKLAYNEEDKTHYAMKILSKKKLMKKAGIFGRMAPGRKGSASPLAKVYREIALLKKLDHPNVVKLVEVLDDPDEDNLYLVFELVQRGEILQVPTDKPLDEETARINFRDVVMGVEYLHYQRIVHRDIKPSNLLVDSEGRIKIADLGVSAELRASGELLSGPTGTPAFAAPETTTPGAHYSGTLCDVWSMGVTLYSLVTGRVPWDGAGSVVGVQAAIRTEPLQFPDSPPALSSPLRDLVARMLAKDPAERITLAGIKAHPWLTRRGAEPLPSEADNCRLPVTVTDEEVERVVTRVPKLDTLILIKTMLKQHSFQNPFMPKRSGRTGCSEAEPGSPQIVSARRTNEPLSRADATAKNAKTEQFHKAGRSNSAPDSYDWQTNGRQISIESTLTPVTEVTSHEFEAVRR